nr:DUF2304 family protein [Palaeococcus ferrophilus]
MYVAQYIAFVIIIGLMLYVLGKYGKKEFDWRDFLFWESLLLVMLIIAAFPVKISMEIRNILGLGRGLDSLFLVAIGFAYILLFKLYLAVDRLEREITELTRNFGIEMEQLREKLEK